MRIAVWKDDDVAGRELNALSVDQRAPARALGHDVIRNQVISAGEDLGNYRCAVGRFRNPWIRA
jgi:hypothetical protein